MSLPKCPSIFALLEFKLWENQYLAQDPCLKFARLHREGRRTLHDTCGGLSGDHLDGLPGVPLWVLRRRRN